MITSRVSALKIEEKKWDFREIYHPLHIVAQFEARSLRDECAKTRNFPANGDLKY